jgi:hypothetical protein
MNPTIRLQHPYTSGNRRIYPVVAEVVEISGNSIVASVVPLALLLEEEGVFSCILLGGDSLATCLEKLAGA